MALRRTRPERRGSASALLIVGLANPGAQYAGSRHNVGGDALHVVGERHHVMYRAERRLRAHLAAITTSRGLFTLAVPTTFMNDVGAAIGPLLRRASIDDLTRLVIVHDELDLEPGRLQLKFAGGLAGHNGLRSIAAALGTQDFTRLRVGIGKPPSKEQGADYVLARPRGGLGKTLRASVVAAADAVETLLEYDFDEAQRLVNRS